MIPLKFFRDKAHVYINSPDDTTKQMTIAEFESVFNVDSSELPAYTSSDGGKVLAVNNGGTGLEWGASYIVIHLNDEGTALDKTWSEIKNAVIGGKLCVLIDDYDPNAISISYLYYVYSVDGEYGCVVDFYQSENNFKSIKYSCDSADGFPAPITN